MLPEDYADYRHDLVFKARHTAVGVHEAWVLANARYPRWPLSRRLELAEHVVRDIADNEPARFYWGSWTDPAHTEPIADTVLAEVLLTPETWVAQSGELLVWFTVSEEPELSRR